MSCGPTVLRGTDGSAPWSYCKVYQLRLRRYYSSNTAELDMPGSPLCHWAVLGYASWPPTSHHLKASALAIGSQAPSPVRTASHARSLGPPTTVKHFHRMNLCRWPYCTISLESWALFKGNSLGGVQGRNVRTHAQQTQLHPPPHMALISVKLSVQPRREETVTRHHQYTHT
jgi:hypothetical protein